MTGPWLREEQTDLASEKILSAASRAFVELGVAGAGMADIARYAGCSRGTLYRYFKSRHELHIAYVNDSAIHIAARVKRAIQDIESPRERLIESIIRSLDEVRSDPGMSAWFAAGESGFAARMSRGSEVVESLAEAFVLRLLIPGDRDPSSRLRARWLVRVIVSLLQVPGESEAEERELIARFALPGIFDDLRG
jgi:AcrR family transcriptional regulator